MYFHRAGLRAAFVLLPILGLSWIFGFLSVSDGPTLIFTYLFTICNSLQVRCGIVMSRSIKTATDLFLNVVLLICVCPVVIPFSWFELSFFQGVFFFIFHCLCSFEVSSISTKTFFWNLCYHLTATIIYRPMHMFCRYDLLTRKSLNPRKGPETVRPSCLHRLVTTLAEHAQ